jgi:hypothetical protein
VPNLVTRRPQSRPRDQEARIPKAICDHNDPGRANAITPAVRAGWNVSESVAPSGGLECANLGLEVPFDHRQEVQVLPPSGISGLISFDGSRCPIAYVGGSMDGSRTWCESEESDGWVKLGPEMLSTWRGGSSPCRSKGLYHE